MTTSRGSNFERAPFGQEVVEEELRTYVTGCGTALACVRADSEQGTPRPGRGDPEPLTAGRRRSEADPAGPRVHHNTKELGPVGLEGVIVLGESAQDL